MNASKCRKEGRESYCEGSDPHQECPYKDTYARECWIQGFFQEGLFRREVEVERLEREEERDRREEEIKYLFGEDFDDNYLDQMQSDYDAGKISSVRELLFMAYATGFKACLDN